MTFSGFEIDVAARELRRNQQQVALEPKAFDLLCLLIEHRDRVVTRDELVEVVWQGRIISDSAVSTAIKAARQAVGDDGRSQGIIRTIHGRGYRFVADLDAGITTLSADSRLMPAASTSAPTNLKRRRRTLIGRDQEKQAILDRLRRGRIVSIVGPGGVGKTALAMDVAFDLKEEFEGGVWFCELVPVQADQVESTVLGAIDSSAGAGPVDAARIAERFGDAPTLLVLDNCEHVIEASARLAGELYDLMPNLALLVTSREALEIPQERINRLAGLSYAASDSVAVEMFQRCASHVTNVTHTEESKEIVRQITERLEGLPLAIELAAPQLASRTPQELLDALDDQLSVLATRRRHGEARHNAMDDAIGWSYDLLDANQRQALAALSMFSGAFTVEAAEAICDTENGQGMLHDLVGQSMVTFAPESSVSRFRLLEPIRQFARRQLDENQLQSLSALHASWFAARAVELGKAMRGAGEIEACEALTAEWSDFGRALAWGREHQQTEIAVEPLLALHIHLLWQLRIEAFGWLEAGVAACDLSDATQAEADVVRTMGAWSAGELDRCDALLASSKALSGETVESAYMGFYVNFVREDFARAVECGQAARQLALESADPVWRITASAFLACGMAMVDGEDEEIPKLLDEVGKDLALYPWPSGRCCESLARLVTSFGRGASEDVLKYRRAVEEAANRCYAPWFKITAAGLENAQNVRSEKETRFQLSMYARNVSSAILSGDVIQLPTILRSTAICLVDLKEYELAAKLCGLIPNLRGLGERGSLSPGYEDAVVTLQNILPDDRLEALTEIGRTWNLIDVANALEAAISE